MSSPKPVSRRKSPIPKASRNVPFAAAISVIRSRPRAVSTSATIGTLGSRFAVSVTWSTDSTIASITPPIEVPASLAKSSTHQGVPKPLIRTQSVCPAPSQPRTLSRAAGLSFGATASSMSRTTMSARERAAASNRSAFAPLTNNQLRARTGSIREPTPAGSAAAVSICSYMM